MKKLIILTLIFIPLWQGYCAEREHPDMDIFHMPQPIPLTQEETKPVAEFLKLPLAEVPKDKLAMLKGENPSYFQNVSHLQRDLNALEAALPSTCDQERLRLLKVFCGWRTYNQNQHIPENLKEDAKDWVGEMAAWYFKGFLESPDATAA